MTEPQPLEARAHVERKHHVQRNLLEACQIDALTHAIVEHLEIVGGQTLHRAAVFRHEDVHAHGLDTAREGLPAGSTAAAPPAANAAISGDQRTS